MSQDTYFYTIDNELPPFAPVPLAILTESHLSAEAKVIYALILSRTQLSASEKNRGTYADANGFVFVYYTINHLAENAGFSKYAVKKALNELSKYKLLLRISQGKGKANKLYLLIPDKHFQIEENKKDFFIPELSEKLTGEDSIYGKSIKVTYDKPVAEIRPG